MPCSGLGVYACMHACLNVFTTACICLERTLAACLMILLLFSLAVGKTQADRLRLFRVSGGRYPKRRKQAARNGGLNSASKDR